MVVAYSEACDALCRRFWADKYGISPDDPFRHTSDAARLIVSAVFDDLASPEDVRRALRERYGDDGGLSLEECEEACVMVAEIILAGLAP